MANTKQCPNCGLENDSGNAVCANCQTPLTAYAGQLRGEAYQGRLAAQVERLETRPPAVIAMVVFLIAFTLFWPLASVISAFLHREGLNAEGTNYVASAFGAIGPILTAIFLIPVSVALGVLAWMTWTQRTWTWNADLVALIAFAVFACIRYPVYHFLTFLWVILAAALAFLWFRPATKAWFGLS